MSADTLPELFGRRWPADPDTVLATVPGGPTLTYGGFHALSTRQAMSLRRLGVVKGDRVAAQVEKSPEVLGLHLACLRSGAALLPLNTAYTEEEVAYLVADAEPRVFVHDPGAADPPSGPVPVTLDELGAGDETRFDDVPVGSGDLAALLYTSGTTGRPKGAMLTHGNLASNAETLRRAWGFGPGDVLLHALPLFHAHGLFVAAHCVLASGAAMVLLPRFDVDAVVAALPRCSVFMGVPTHYVRLLDHAGFDRETCRGIRLFVSGSAPLLPTTHERVRERTGQVVLERYGMTETVMITSNPLDGERRAGTVGPALPGVEVRTAGYDAVGGVEVRGPNVFAGYWGRPGLKEAESTADGWFRTGDLGTLDGDGYLTLVGRAKDLVITGGLNVYPKEVEAVLDALPGVAESAVIGVPDPDLGEAVVAILVPEAGSVLDAASVRATARDRLAGFKVPKAVHVVDHLPRNAMGKVQKSELRGQMMHGEVGPLPA